MDFIKCSIAGTSYGVVSSEVEIAAAKRIAKDLNDHSLNALDIQKIDLKVQGLNASGNSFKSPSFQEPDIEL